jgi:hypothetical protein
LPLCRLPREMNPLNPSISRSCARTCSWTWRMASSKWMLAGEFLPLARFFDRLEVRLRELGRWIKERWNTSPDSV